MKVEFLTRIIRSVNIFHMKKMLNINLVSFFMFTAFLWPITIDKYSVNYLYFLFPLYAYLSNRKFHTPPRSILIAMFIFLFIYILGAAENIYYYSNFDYRSLLSFIIFMSIFSFSLYDINKSDINSFKAALVFVSIIFSLLSVYGYIKYYYFQYEITNCTLKDMVGSQRYTFLYFLAFYVLLFEKIKNKHWQYFKILGLLIIISGLFLSFSRAAIIAFFISNLALFIAKLNSNIFFIKKTIKNNKFKSFIVPIAIILILCIFLQKPINFFMDKLAYRYAFFSIDQLLTPETSEGTRINIWLGIINFISNNPFTGNSYLGAYRLPELKTGSAHNQYMDVLLRVGWVGFMAYLYLISKVTLFLKNKEQALFWGILGILVYGFFHETFKESHGGFVLAFLVGIYASNLNTKNHPYT